MMQASLNRFTIQLESPINLGSSTAPNQPINVMTKGAAPMHSKHFETVPDAAAAVRLAQTSF
jgi:hypothetical protein